MMYEISVKNLNNTEVFRGQNFTEELTKLAIERYSTYPIVNVWQSPEPEEPNQAKKYAEYLKNYCDSRSCFHCQLYDHDESVCTVEHPCDWELKEGDSE